MNNHPAPTQPGTQEEEATELRELARLLGNPQAQSIQTIKYYILYYNIDLLTPFSWADHTSDLTVTKYKNMNLQSSLPKSWCWAQFIPKCCSFEYLHPNFTYKTQELQDHPP